MPSSVQTEEQAEAQPEKTPPYSHTVADLKRKLADLPDDLPIVVSVYVDGKYSDSANLTDGIWWDEYLELRAARNLTEA